MHGARNSFPIPLHIHVYTAECTWDRKHTSQHNFSGRVSIAVTITTRFILNHAHHFTECLNVERMIQISHRRSLQPVRTYSKPNQKSQFWISIARLKFPVDCRMLWDNSISKDVAHDIMQCSPEAPTVTEHDDSKDLKKTEQLPAAPSVQSKKDDGPRYLTGESGMKGGRGEGSGRGGLLLRLVRCVHLSYIGGRGRSMQWRGGFIPAPFLRAVPLRARIIHARAR